MIIRQATQQDSALLAELIFASAPRTLTAAFQVSADLSVKRFLAESLQNIDGQYGYQNHWLADLNNQVIGCVSAWHTGLSDGFHRATLAGISQFYGLENALSVLHTNQALQDCMPPLKTHEWGIGHLSVLDAFQRQGVATALLDQMLQLAIENHKSTICLDVEASNSAALSFYRRLGFSVEAEAAVTARMAELGIGTHLHLSKAVSSSSQ